MVAKIWEINAEDYDTWMWDAQRRAANALPVWQDHPGIRNALRAAPRLDGRHYHYPRCDTQGNIQYFQSLADARRNKLTTISPGRYLAKYFKPELSDAQIKELAEWSKNGKPTPYDHLDVNFAATAEDIAKIYRAGPESCMRNFPERTHPTRIYAAGDLQVAYLKDAQGAIIARALVWPEKKVVGRVYPTTAMAPSGGPRFQALKDAQTALQNKLRALGYTSYNAGGSFEGARLKLERTRHRRPSGWATIRLPYLDGGYNVEIAPQADTLRVTKKVNQWDRGLLGGYTEGYARIHLDALRPLAEAA